MTDKQKIKILLRNGDIYNGDILSRDELHITLLDRYGERVTIHKDAIMVLKEVQG